MRKRINKTLKQAIGVTSVIAASTFNVHASGYKGVDLSYVNEMEDCGAVYYENGSAKDPFQIFADHGANVVRVRLWHDPTARHTLPSSYSGYDDVVKTIQRAKDSGMRVMLDFHYSDNWTDPADQVIPAAWHHLINNTSALEDELYQYTYDTLSDLNSRGLMPELVQVGNETNGNILSEEGADLYPVDFSRQARILNAGIQAVRDAGEIGAIKPEVILHVADPNNGDWWYTDIRDGGIADYDIIGLSFYPEWHEGSVSEIGDIVQSLKSKFGKEVMIVEVGAPWSSDNNDGANNMMTVLPSPYGDPSVSGQRNFLVDLAHEVHNRGGYGTVYWEPAWVSTGCETQWGTGSHWDNATFFDFSNNLINDGGVKFLEEDFGALPAVDAGNGGSGGSGSGGNASSVTFKVDMSANDNGQAYVTGDFNDWQIVSMSSEGNGVYSLMTTPTQTSGGYYFLNGSDWSDRESVPSECALAYESDRAFDTSNEVVYAYQWESCSVISDGGSTTPDPEEPVSGFPDYSSQGNATFRVEMPSNSQAYITGELGGSDDWNIIQMTSEGNNVYSFTKTISEGTSGAFYFLNGSNWSDRETVPTACAVRWDSDREFVIGAGYNVINLKWALCDSL